MESDALVRRVFNLTDQDSIEPKDMDIMQSYIEECRLITPIDLNEDGKLDIMCEAMDD